MFLGTPCPPRKLRSVAVGVGFIVAPCGCLFGVGPQAGLTFEGRPTLGWELGAASFALGESFVVGTPKDEAALFANANLNPDPRGPVWNRRTYLVWEPRWGASLLGISGSYPAWLLGGGGSLGMRWDVSDVGASAHHTDYGFIGGVWAGATAAGAALNTPSSCLDTEWHGYVSIALGVRGNEVYLAPKLGVFGVPKICLHFDLPVF
jgi:hypothetical protein